MRTSIIIISLLIITQQFKCFGQDITFEHLYSTPMNEMVYDIIESGSGDIFLCGYVSLPDQFLSKTDGLILKLNKHGDFLDKTIIDYENRRYCITNILTDTNNTLILSGYSSDTFHQAQGTFGNFCIELKKITENLEIQSERNYCLPQDYRYYNMLTRKSLNSNILIGGSVMPYDVPYVFIYKIDQYFDSLAANIYTDNWRTCFALKQMYNGSIWISDGLKFNYYIIDTFLNLIEFNDARPYWLMQSFGNKWDSDTSFFLAGQWGGGSGDDIAFFKQFDPIDSTGNNFNSWGSTDTLDIPAYEALDFKNKDSIFIGGTKNFWSYFDPSPSWYFIIQTDSNLNVRWERFYGGDARYTMWKIIATNDGGCIVAGNRYDYENVSVEETDIHILKLNSQGLLVKTPDQPAIEMHEALVFPNPGTDRIKVRIALHYRQSRFEMFDMHGRMVLSEQINGKWGEVNTANLSTGTYVYRIFSQDGLFESGKWIKR